MGLLDPLDTCAVFDWPVVCTREMRREAILLQMCQPFFYPLDQPYLFDFLAAMVETVPGQYQGCSLAGDKFLVGVGGGGPLKCY